MYHEGDLQDEEIKKTIEDAEVLWEQWGQDLEH